MYRRTPLEWICQRKMGAFLLVLIWTSLCIGLVQNVQAQTQLVNVHVTFLGYGWRDCDDGASGPADVYFKVTIDGVERNNKGDEYTSPFYSCNPKPDFRPREFSQPDVDLSKGTIPIKIEAWDDDDPWSDDDVCNIGPPGQSYMDLSVDLVSCKITGDVTGDCGTSLESPRGCLEFKVDVVDSPRASGLNVRCLHDPIWPQPNDPVTITAEALDGNANLISGIVDNIEIWIDDKDAPYQTTESTGINTKSATYTPPSGADQIAYGCRVFDDGERVFTGWRVVQIGDPPHGRAVPILYTGLRANRVDIVFIADEDDFLGAGDLTFQDEVHDLIRNGYFAGLKQSQLGGRIFLRNQDGLNFWLALDTGDTDGDHDLRPPSNWYKDYNFAETGALIHSNPLQRDFARRTNRIFTTGLGGLPAYTLLHETGHIPFGLGDEYCEVGRNIYKISSPNKNIYSSQEDCLADPLAQGVADACQQITDPAKSCAVSYYRLDSASTYWDDLMTDHGYLTPNPADQRRINWLFDLCRSASCD